MSTKRYLIIMDFDPLSYLKVVSKCTYHIVFVVSLAKRMSCSGNGLIWLSGMPSCLKANQYRTSTELPLSSRTFHTKKLATSISTTMGSLSHHSIPFKSSFVKVMRGRLLVTLFSAMVS